MKKKYNRNTSEWDNPGYAISYDEQFFRHRTAKPYGNMQRMRPPMEHGVSYGMDFITGFPPSGPSRHSWLLVVRDLFSGYVHLLPCKENLKLLKSMTD